MYNFINSYVTNNDVEKILKKYYKKKRKKTFEITKISREAVPCYIIKVKVSIKRGFKLAPRIVEHNYLIDAVSGKVHRIMDEEISGYDELVIDEMKAQYSKSKCEEIVRQKFYKYVIRFYKSFWLPEFETVSVQKVYLDVVRVLLQNESGAKETCTINGFSGDVIKLT